MQLVKLITPYTCNHLNKVIYLEFLLFCFYQVFMCEHLTFFYLNLIKRCRMTSGLHLSYIQHISYTEVKILLTQIIKKK